MENFVAAFAKAGEVVRITSIALMIALASTGITFATGLGIPPANPLVWSSPAKTEFQGHVLDVPPGVEVATDTLTYFYATTYDWQRATAVDPACQTAEPTGGVFVLVDPSHCMWVLHPNVGCSGTDLCATAVGAVLAGPATVSSAFSLAPRTASQYNYAQVGVQKHITGLVASGEQSTIAMNGGVDTYTGSPINSCHYRWGGLYMDASSPHTFMQSGTWTGCGTDVGTNRWRIFCYGWDDQISGGTWGTWSYFQTSSYQTDTNAHAYQVASNAGSTIYYCKYDGAVQTSHWMEQATWTSPTLNAITEIGASTVGLDPAQETVKQAIFNPSIQYYNGFAWTDAPTEDYFNWAWNSVTSPPPAGTTACPLFNDGVSYSPLSLHHWISMGAGLSCANGNAW